MQCTITTRERQTRPVTIFIFLVRSHAMQPMQRLIVVSPSRCARETVSFCARIHTPRCLVTKLQDGNRDAQCLCKYCSKRAQKDITYQMADIMPLRKTPTQSPGPSRRPIRDKKPKKPSNLSVFTSVTRAHVTAKVSKVPAVPDRSSDLRAINCKTSMKLKRWFRPGELLWCALDPPILGPNGADSITFWPGLVEDAPPSSQGGESTVQESEDDSPPWTVQQSTVYVMKLLAVNREYLLRDDQVLPYQAYAPTAVVDTLQNFPRANLKIEPEDTTKFDPCPPNQVTSFNDAASPYAVALQIAARLTAYWSLTDDWEYTYTIPSEPNRNTADSLAAAIVRAQSAPNAPQSRPYPNTSAPDPLMSQSEFNSLSTQVMGPIPPSQKVTQTRYQGVWWGAERIWVDDFVRLKVARRCIAPQGAEHIFTPRVQVHPCCRSWGRGYARFVRGGCGFEGLFLRLNGLLLVDIPQRNGSGPKKECRACGMLYELVDQDWVDPSAVQPNVAGTSASAAPTSTQPLPRLSAIAGPSSAGPSFANRPKHPLPQDLSSLLPSPPDGYRFRQILEDGYEAVMSLTMIGGRYYPSILHHPLLSETVGFALSNALENNGLMDYSYLWALEGLTPGFNNSVDPVESKKVAKQCSRKLIRRRGRSSPLS
ncbi:Cryptic loci regulator [Salix suchowensis]|nr:Cryptic loci regulator [Salix suchowensis]